MMAPQKRRLTYAAGLFAAAGVLGAAAAPHAGLRFVDFLFFAERAERMPTDWARVEPLYPGGYPALLSALHGLTGDVLLGGKLLSVVAGLLAVSALGVLGGPGLALWGLGQAALLQWSATEGTDLPAAACGLAALAAAHRRQPALAGALAGAGCLLRYTGVLALPAVLLTLPGGRLRAGGAFLLSTAPHWLLALLTGQSPWPDQSYNLAIAAGHPTALWSMDTLLRWPSGVQGAVRAVDPIALVGLVGLLWPGRRAVRRLRWGLGLWAGLHLSAFGLAFSNPRLVLPATLALLAGAVGLPRPLVGLAGIGLAGIGLLVVHLGPARALDDAERELQRVVPAVASLEGPFLTTDPWVYQRRPDGWLRAGVPIRALRGDPRAMDPNIVVQEARRLGLGGLVVDKGRVLRSYPGLASLLGKTDHPGLERVYDKRGWVVYRLKPAG